MTNRCFFRIKLRGLVIICLIPLIFVGCNRVKDPGKAGFIDGVINLTDGTYDKRLEARRQALEAARAQREGEYQVNDNLLREAGDREVKRRRLSLRHAHIEKQASDLAARIDQLTSRDAASRKRIKELRARSAAAQREITALRAEVPASERGAILLERRGRELELEIRRLAEEAEALGAS